MLWTALKDNGKRKFKESSHIFIVSLRTCMYQYELMVKNLLPKHLKFQSITMAIIMILASSKLKSTCQQVIWILRISLTKWRAMIILIYQDGKPCLGNIGNGVIRMLAEFELFGALQIIHKFLHSYNPHSPYQQDRTLES